ncbi:hypothetical protein RKD42_007936 [Streptomyces ambofaciens]
MAPDQFYGVVPVCGLGDDLDVRIGGEDGAHPGTDHRFVVGDQHPDHRALTG